MNARATPPPLGADAPREHPWRVSRRQAADIQRRLATLVVQAPLPASGPGSPLVAAGLDAAYALDGSAMWAAAVAMDRGLRVLDVAIVEGEPDSPYAPGYLAFREGRLLLAALRALRSAPGVVFVDGHGVVHERGLGLASHLGVLAGVPTVGVAKTPFHAIDRSPGPERGEALVLTKEWGAHGAAVRLKSRSKQVYVSPGHLTDLDSAIALALEWSTGRRRVPEPLALAHTASVLARNAARGVTEAAAALRALEEGRPR
ncbi:endonuclease V [Coriobacteriia bacterium Es71-Z0120]|uniref:endonuclease V n=1 Tax=Parvivirga hydrogeniphila TaxID=2939460 RepID=UPI002260926F|nr:endonuclease V [Parvivirga hydrogeniphila]MCL4078309.1 endonuclease V [Parvivirga hydrogeniphila]